MAKKFFTLESLTTLIDEIKSYVASAVSGKADTSHSHSISNVTNLQSSLDAKVPTSRTVNGKALSSNITLSSSDVGAASSTHSHNDIYYTETEIDTKLASKSDSTHNHDSKYDAKGSASAVQTNLDTVSDTLDSHTENADIHVTTTNKSNWNTAYNHSQAAHARTDATKVADSTTNGNILINGTETNVYSHPNSGVTAGTYKSVTVNAQGHITSGTNPTTLAGYGITDADPKGAADSALASAKTYADNAATKVKNDLLNGAGGAYDTLKELGDLIVDNQDAIEALETIASGKADATHGHAIADVSGLQSALDGKAASSHGTHVSYSTTAPVMDGTASVGSASTVARSDHKHPTDTSRASKTEFDTHVADTTKHITSTERTNWGTAYTHSQAAHAPSNAQPNQNAFSNVKVGTTTIAADTTTDTLELVGSNVTITPDATNDKVTIAVADGSTSTKGIVQLTNSTSSTSTTTAATPNSVKSAYDLANTAKTNAATAQTRADNAYNLADSKVDSLSDLGITATATELNYVDGVTSNVQTQLNTLTSNKVSKTGDTMTGDLTIEANFGSVRFNDADGNKMSVLQANNDSHTTSIYAYPTDKSTYYEKYDFPTPDTGRTSNKSYRILTTKDVTASVAELNFVDGVTSNIQTQLNGKASSDHTHSSYVNQNAFSNIAVSGQTTVAADTATDTVTFVGSNMSITTNATTDTVTFSVANASTSAKGVVQLVDSATNTATDKAATANAVNTAYTLASTANTTANSAKTTAESKSTVAASTTNGNIKINGTETTVYTHPTTAGNKHIPSGGSSGQVLKYSASGTATWGTDKDTTYSLSSGDNNGTIKITPSSGSAYNVAVKGLGSVAYTNTVPIANGGTGATTVKEAKNNLEIPTIKKLTQAEYDALPDSKYTDGIVYAITDGESSSSGGTSKPVELTKAQYEALGDSVLNDNILYAITDGDGLTAKNLEYDGSQTGLGNNVQDAIDELNSNLGGFSPVIDETGKIIGYKTSVGGADTVFPFSSEMNYDFVALDYSSLITSQSGGLKSDRTAVLVKVKGKSKVTISSHKSGDTIKISGVFILADGNISSYVNGTSVTVPSDATYLLMRGSYSNSHLYSISVS